MKYYHIIIGSIFTIAGIYSIVTRNHPSKREKFFWWDILDKKAYKIYRIIVSAIVILVGLNLIAKGIFDPNSGYFLVRFK